MKGREGGRKEARKGKEGEGRGMEGKGIRKGRGRKGNRKERKGYLRYESMLAVRVKSREVGK
jgi:hypothetical protein